MVFRIALYVVTTWLIAAHFLRSGNLWLTALCLVAPLLFFLRRRWSLRVLELAAYAAGAIWLATAWHLVVLRRAFGEPWLRGAIILLAVAAVTALAGWMVRDRVRPLAAPAPDAGRRSCA